MRRREFICLFGAMASAFLLNGFVLCSFGAQADVLYSKHGEWTVAYLEVGNLNGCRATRQFPDQTVFQMVQIQSGTDKGWVIFISNPRWNAWIGNRKEIRLSLVTDWPTTKPWPYTFSTSGDMARSKGPPVKRRPLAARG
jgi:hypothetical protein